MLFTHPFTAVALAAGLVDSHRPEVLIIALLVCTCFGLFSAVIADGVGRNGWLWFVVGSLPVIGWAAPAMCLVTLPLRTRIPLGSPVPWQRVTMAGLRGFAGGMVAVVATYAALVLVLCLVNPDVAGELVSLPALARLTEGIGVVGLTFALSHLQRASKGLDPDVTDIGPRKEPHAAPPVDPAGPPNHRAAFKLLRQQYERERGRLFLVALGYFFYVFAPFMMWPWAQEHVPSWVGIVLFFVGGVIIIIRLHPDLPNCPACGKSIGLPFGPHCPECAGPLQDEGAGARRRWYCRNATKFLFAGRRRNFTYHACSHCGVMLDDDGI